MTKTKTKAKSARTTRAAAAPAKTRAPREPRIHSVELRGVSMYQMDLVKFVGPKSKATPAGQMRTVSVTLAWTGTRGFGEVTIVQRGARLEVHSEGLSEASVRAVLRRLVDDADIL